jgi:outer membrane receptor protein involved in Fe transport
MVSRSPGHRCRSVTTNPGLKHVSGYNTTDFVVGYRADLTPMTGVPKQTTLKLGVYNVFDHKSITEIAGSPAGVNNIKNTTLTYSFLPGRMIYGSLSVDF